MIFRCSALAAALLVSTSSAFAPSSMTAQVRSAATTTTTTRSSSSNVVLASAATEEDTPLSPLTIWGEPITDIRKLQQDMRNMELPEHGVTVSAVNDAGLQSNDVNGQLAWVKENAMELKTKMERHGAVIFKDFDLMKTQEGFQTFYEALEMIPCLDPLHSVSARPTVNGDKKSPVYEAVNKESRKNFFIGMHNEFVGTRAPRAAAFVCLKAAETGGEFLIADGRRVFCDLDPDLVEELYQRDIRYSVMELPFFGWMDNLPEPIQGPASGAIKGLVSAAINAKVDFNVEMNWGQGGYDKTRMLQARAAPQPPIVLHPVTKDPTWFCNVHSHSSKLRKDREALYGAERFEDGASQINKSDMFFGDDGGLTDAQLDHMDEVTKKNVRYVKMTEGDVVLLDNYKTMHGRNVFDGTRKHGVAWFGGWEGEEEMKESFQKESQVTDSSPPTETKEELFFAN